MRHLYQKKRELHLNNRIQAGKDELIVESYDTLSINVDTSNEPDVITLANVAYVPEFLTNVAALSIFAAERMHVDSAMPHMHVENNTKVNIY